MVSSGFRVKMIKGYYYFFFSLPCGLFFFRLLWNGWKVKKGLLGKKNRLIFRNVKWWNGKDIQIIWWYNLAPQAVKSSSRKALFQETRKRNQNGGYQEMWQDSSPTEATARTHSDGKKDKNITLAMEIYTFRKKKTQTLVLGYVSLSAATFYFSWFALSW